MIAIPELAKLLDEHCMVRELTQMANGHLRIQTKFSYIDGSLIDVYAENLHGAMFGDFATLTDFGNTFALLDEYNVKPWTSIDRLKLLRESVESIRCRIDHDRIIRHVDDEGDLARAMIDIAQACIRASCAVFTKRTNQAQSFSELVKEFIERTRLNCSVGYEHRGPYGKPIRVDFRVNGRTHTSSILSLGGSTTSGAHNQANEIFTRWTDLRDVETTDQLVTIYDGSLGTRKLEDLQRLKKLSVVVPFNQQDEIATLLRS